MAEIVRVTTARVYGSYSRYGEHRDAPAPPKLMSKFPTRAHTLEVVFGSRPDWLFDADRTGRAFGMASLDVVFGGLPVGVSFAEHIEGLRLDLEQIPEPPFAWFVTIAAKRELQAEVQVGEAGWGFPELREVEASELEQCSPAIDAVAAALAAAIGEQFFEQIALPDHTYFSTTGRRAFRLTRSGGEAALSTGRPIESFPFAEVARALSHARREAVALRAPSRWRSAALVEPDLWKRFVAAFLALEVLVEKLAPRSMASIHRNLRSQTGKNAWPVPPELLPEDRLTLVQKFTVVALTLRPRDASQDVTKFKRLKRARDDMLHGEPIDPGTFGSEAIALLNEYWQALV